MPTWNETPNRSIGFASTPPSQHGEGQAVASFRLTSNVERDGLPHLRRPHTTRPSKSLGILLRGRNGIVSRNELRHRTARGLVTIVLRGGQQRWSAPVGIGSTRC